MPFETPPLPGDAVGAYTLHEVLGVGGMATVYRALDSSGQSVALKILHPGKAGTDDARRFQREFLTLRELRDPNVVSVFEAGVQGDYPWIAMELVDGTDLGTLIERWEHDPPPDRFAQVESMLRGLCAALVHVHKAGLIHRDIKPSNVLVTRDGRAMLTDFGVVKAPGQFTTQLTMAGRLVGTIAFMAPEQITGDAVDSRVDLYSLGAVLYVMLTGKRPIQSDTIAGYLARHLTHRPTPPHELNPAVPARLEELCLNLLRKDPAQRYASASQVLSVLDATPDPRRLPVHGREDELAQLMLRIDQVAAGAGGVLVVVAPPGTGKTTLLGELVARATAAGRDLGVADGTDAQGLVTLLSQVGVEADPSAAQGGRGQGISGLADGQSWTLVVDHLDRLPARELGNLTRLVRRRVAIHGEPLLLIGAVEDSRGPAAGLVSGAETGLSPEIIKLMPLDQRAVIAMLRDQGLTGRESVVLAQRLAIETGGVPGAVHELLDTLLKQGWLARRDAGELVAVLAQDALRDRPLPVPPRIRQRELERLGRLAPAAQALAEGLAILGVETPLTLVARLVGLNASAAALAADRMVDGDLVRRQVRGLDDLLQLSTDRLRRVVLERLSEERRGALHREAATLLSRRSRRRPDPVSEDIISHLLAGGESARAYPMLLATAKRRLAAGQLDSAARLLHQAIELRPRVDATLDSAERARLASMLWSLQGQVALRLGELTSSQGAWTRALHEAKEMGDPLALARARGGIGLVLAARGEEQAALLRLGRALEALPPGDPMWAPVGDAQARCSLSVGQADTAAQTWRRVLEVADATGSERTAARAQAGLALCAMATASPEAAIACLARVASRLRVLEEGPSLLPVLLSQAELFLVDGRLREAHQRAIEADRVALASDRQVARIRSLGLAASALLALADVAEARQIATEAAQLAHSRASDNPSALRLAVLPVARALLALHRDELARSILPPLAGKDIRTGARRSSGGHNGAQTRLRAVWALALARQAPDESATLAWDALDTTLSAPPHVAARVSLDALRALSLTHDPGIALAIDRARALVPRTGARLLELECARLTARCGVPESVGPARKRASVLAAVLDHELAAQGRFVRRWSV